jgi:hypothetical protein
MLEFTPANLQSEETRKLIRKPNWIPGGLASLVRALQVVEALKRDLKTDFAGAFRHFLNW